SGDDLTLVSTTDGTKGDIYFHSTSYSINPSGQLTVATDGSINGIDINAGAVSDINSILGNATSVFSFGGIALQNYNAISDYGGSATYALSDNDLYIEDILEVGGNLYAPASGLSGYWQRNSQALSPTNTTDDVLLGAIATSSALVRLPGLNNEDAFFNLGNGGVGIGVTNPTHRLTVKDNGFSGSYLVGLRTDNENMVPLAIYNDSWETNVPSFTVNSFNNGNVSLGTVKDLQFFTSSYDNVKMSITEGGYVGIGTTAPSEIFQINTEGASSNIINSMRFQRRDSDSAGDAGLGIGLDFYLEDAASNPLQQAARIDIVWEDATNNSEDASIRFNTMQDGSLDEALRIDDNGNIGIDTTAPTAKLDIAGDASLSASLVFRSSSPTIDVFNGADLVFNTSAGGDAGLGAVMAVTNEGNVGIGTTAPSAKLDVVGNVVIGDGSVANGFGLLDVQRAATISALIASDVPLKINAHSAQTANLSEWKSSGGTMLASIDASGNLYVAGNITTGGAAAVMMTNKSGGTIAAKSLVIIDSSNVNSFTTTTTAYHSGVYGVVIGDDPTDGDSTCAADESCQVAFGGKVDVNVTNSDAAKGDYVFTSGTAGQGVTHANMHDGLVGIVSDTTNIGSGYVTIYMVHQPDISGTYIADKNRMHNDYWEKATKYEAWAQDDPNNVDLGLFFDTLQDSKKASSSGTIATSYGKKRAGLWGGQSLTSSVTDSSGNNLLGANTVNDVYYYDRSQINQENSNPGRDSTPATLVDLGIDPNWFNGVTLTATDSAVTHSRLSTTYNGSLITTSSRYASGEEDGSIIITIKNNTPTHVTFDWVTYPYNWHSGTSAYARKDTAYTLETGTNDIDITFQYADYHIGDQFKIHSWYLEPETSNDRGEKQEFPEHTFLVAHDSGIDIIDADTNKLWMRFSEGSGYILGSTDITSSSIHALNGRIY
ncbi:MAG: hypothetical protein JSW41_03025, partial [Candidatus Aenigmatarchaeota archaeon]